MDVGTEADTVADVSDSCLKWVAGDFCEAGTDGERRDGDIVVV